MHVGAYLRIFELLCLTTIIYFQVINLKAYVLFITLLIKTIKKPNLYILRNQLKMKSANSFKKKNRSTRTIKRNIHNNYQENQMHPNYKMDEKVFKDLIESKVKCTESNTEIRLTS